MNRVLGTRSGSFAVHGTSGGLRGGHEDRDELAGFSKQRRDLVAEMCLPTRSCGRAETKRTTDAPKLTIRAAISSPFMRLILRNCPAMSILLAPEIVAIAAF